jgi:hypothetical protein
MSDEQERAAVRAMDRAMPAASEPQDGLPKAADVLVRKT